MELFDTHCHIDFHHFDDDRDAAFERMRENSVSRIIDVSVELEQTRRLVELSESRDGVWFSVGIHPNHEIDSEPTVQSLLSLAGHQKCVAIGESGMDFSRHRVPPDIQESRFRTHIQAAKQLDKPVIVHMRDADEATFRIMQEEDIMTCGGIMHCFSSSLDAARQALDMGLSISFSGNVTFKNSHELRDVAAFVPDASLLIETDAPYLAPVPQRGKRNEPSFVRHVAECIAQVRGQHVEAIAEMTTKNALLRFKLQ